MTAKEFLRTKGIDLDTGFVGKIIHSERGFQCQNVGIASLMEEFARLTYQQMQQDTLPDEIKNFNGLSRNRPDSFWKKIGVKFYLGKSKVYSTTMGGRPCYIEIREQKEGPAKWCVSMHELVLSKRGKYIHEPIPSSRTKAFIQQTRFDTKEEALNAWIDFEHINRGKDLRLKVG